MVKTKKLKQNNPWKAATFVLAFLAIILLIVQSPLFNYIQIPGSDFGGSSIILNKITSDYTIGKPYFLCKSETEYMTFDSIESLEKFGVDWKNKCILIQRIEK
jgi:hypothetical protein